MEEEMTSGIESENRDETDTCTVVKMSMMLGIISVNVGVHLGAEGGEEG